MQKIGRYQITRELGRGAMGVVYHAIDPTIGRPVAIKTLRLRDLDDAEQRSRLRERLFREARSAGALSHPGIVTIYDMDEVDGLAYIAMEFVDGETLEDILSRPQPIAKDRLSEVLRQAAAALDYAHRKGVIHRDVKPANIMIERSGAVKITDFGIAKLTELEGQTLTGVLVGTPNYMSPEQVQGHEIDGRSDQFSLAVIAYEMLSGERPFTGDQISTVVYKIVHEQPAAVQSLNASLNETADKTLRKGLAKRPDRRYPTCTAFTIGVEAALSSIGNWRVIARKRSAPAVSSEAITRTFRPVQKPKAAARPEPKAESKPAPTKEKRSALGWLIPFLGGFVILTGLLALVAWQTGLLDAPWIQDLLGGGSSEAPSPPPARQLPTLPPAVADRRSPMPAAPQPDADPKPADAPARQPESASAAPTTTPAARIEPATNQAVLVLTDPAGAVATLDGSREFTCSTPCKLPTPSGTHTITVTLAGYQPERREIRVVHDDLELPLISMRAANGVLLLTSEPSNLSVSVDGRPTGYQTPIRMTLAAGVHRVSVGHNNMQSSGTVEIRNGDLTTLKLITNRP